MIMTRKSDYALRICRVLKDGKVHNVSEICRKESIPRAFAYKILRNLESHGIVRSERGSMGGYCLSVSIDDVTIYDVVSILENNVAVLHCMKEECSRNRPDHPCRIHREIMRIQNIMEEEMCRFKLGRILDEE